MKTGDRASGTLRLEDGIRRRVVIATLAQGSRTATGANWEAFRQGLRALGHGTDIAIESRWADGHVERLPEPAAELVRLAPEVIAAGSAAAAEAARQATLAIPIVVTVFNDPIGSGLVAGLARPGGNVTGARERADALVVLGGPLAFTQRSRIAELAASHKLPAIYYERELAAAGGLMSYGADLKDTNRRAASYVDKILKGAKPADLPVEQPTKFELVINLKTARELGLTIPSPMLALADEVIE
jgi:ABC-type uncharacterized transport system substrate-binding protein